MIRRYRFSLGLSVAIRLILTMSSVGLAARNGGSTLNLGWSCPRAIPLPRRQPSRPVAG
jgi:hypothetical protein